MMCDYGCDEHVTGMTYQVLFVAGRVEVSTQSDVVQSAQRQLYYTIIFTLDRLLTPPASHSTPASHCNRLSLPQLLIPPASHSTTSLLDELLPLHPQDRVISDYPQSELSELWYS